MEAKNLRKERYKEENPIPTARNMEKMVHVWKIKCRSCGAEFEHVFRARDVFKPHIFNSLELRCPKCGSVNFDPVTPSGKETLENWKMQHPDLNLDSLPDYSYMEDTTQ